MGRGGRRRPSAGRGGHPAHLEAAEARWRVGADPLLRGAARWRNGNGAPPGGFSGDSGARWWLGREWPSPGGPRAGRQSWGLAGYPRGGGGAAAHLPMAGAPLPILPPGRRPGPRAPLSTPPAAPEHPPFAPPRPSGSPLHRRKNGKRKKREECVSGHFGTYSFSLHFDRNNKKWKGVSRLITTIL